VTTTQIVWTYIFNLVFLSEPLNFWSFAGTGLILGYMLFVAAMKMNGGRNSAVREDKQASSKEYNNQEEEGKGYELTLLATSTARTSTALTEQD
jgi:hypothetical protein